MSGLGRRDGAEPGLAAAQRVDYGSVDIIQILAVDEVVAVAALESRVSNRPLPENVFVLSPVQGAGRVGRQTARLHARFEHL